MYIYTYCDACINVYMEMYSSMNMCICVYMTLVINEWLMLWYMLTPSGPQVCIYVYIYMYTYTCIHLYVYIYMYMYSSMNMSICMLYDAVVHVDPLGSISEPLPPLIL
jgi:hypothetical protein